MDTDAAPPDSPKPTPPASTRDPLIRYSVFAALGCAGVCMIFTILYVFSYSLDSTLSFERHFDSYLASGNSGNLSTVLGLHMAQNRMFLQSCGMVAGIFFAFLGLALFLVGIQGTVDANGDIKDFTESAKRVAPGGFILLASMIFVGVSAMHPVDFIPGPIAGPAPTASAAPPAAPTLTTPAPTQATTPGALQPAPQPTTQTPTQSQLQPTPPPASAPPARLTPQSAQVPATQLPAVLLAQPASQPAPTPQTSAQTLPAATQRPTQRPTLVTVNRKTPTPPPPAQHRFQP